MKTIQKAAVGILILSLVGCGKSINIKTKGVTSSAMTSALGAVQVVTTAKKGIDPTDPNQYLFTYTVKSGDQSVTLSMNASDTFAGSDSKTLNGVPIYAQTKCDDVNCEYFAVLFNLDGSLGASSGTGNQFAILYFDQIADSSGNPLQLIEQDSTQYGDVGSALTALYSSLSTLK